MRVRLFEILVMSSFASAGMMLSLWAVSKLEENSIRSSKSLATLISSLLISSLSDEEIYRRLQEVIKDIDFPVAVLDENGRVRALKNVELEYVKNLRFSEPIRYYENVVGTIKYDHPMYLRVLRLINLVIYGGILATSLWLFLSFYLSIKYEQAEFWMSFAKGLAHQLATPVSSLYGWYEMLKDGLPEDAKIGLRRDMDRISSILRRFSKIGGGLILERVEISGLIEKTLRELSGKYKSSISIRFESEGEFWVNADGELIVWAFENMIKNSVEAGADKVKVKIERRRNRVCISVVDNGRGFTKKELKMAFKRSFSTKQKGWGMGLILIRRIAELHKGSVFVERSEPFFETIITLCLQLESSL